MKARLVEVQTRLNVEGKDFSKEFFLDRIEKHSKSITKWALAVHDSDVYTLEDESAKHIPEGYKVGDHKPEHIHIMMQLAHSREFDDIAKWFDVESRFVLKSNSKSKSNQHKFNDMCLYLIHGNDINKFQYDPEIVESNFDYQAEMQRYQLFLEGSASSRKIEDLISKVTYEGMPLSVAEQSLGAYTYLKNDALFKRAHEKYITEYAQMPPFRMNIYISGKGGVGKSLASRLLARALSGAVEGISKDYECFFEMGTRGARFEGYEGQPVVIWNEVRSDELISELGRANLFDLLDPYPSKKKQNIKYGSVTLIQQWNIINGIETYQEFLDGIAGAYTDKGGNFHKAEDDSQSYRRFPMIIELNEESFDLLLNQGFMNGTREFKQYMQYAHVVGNFGTVMKRLGTTGAKPILVGMTSPVVDAKTEVEEVALKNQEVEEDVIFDFSDYGKVTGGVLYEKRKAKVELEPEQMTIFDVLEENEKKENQ